MSFGGRLAQVRATEASDPTRRAWPSAEEFDWGKEPENEKGFLHTEKNGQVIKEYLSSPQGNYMEYYDGIYKALREKQEPPVSAEEGLNVIRIITAAYKSKEQQKRINL